MSLATHARKNPWVWRRARGGSLAHRFTGHRRRGRLLASCGEVFVRLGGHDQKHLPRCAECARSPRPAEASEALVAGLLAGGGP